MDHVDGIIAQWRAERPELELAPMALIGRITRLSQHLGREMDKTFAAHGLNAAGFDVLATLRRSGAPYRLSAGELMQNTMVSSGTMTNRIDRLERAGLVDRVPNPEDGRGVLIALTEKGAALIDAAVGDHVATQTRLAEGLEPEEMETLGALLRKMLERAEGGAG
jgi:DNA-binding MarR family transcriptional regulator